MAAETQSDPLAGLFGLRLPPDAAAQLPADLLAAMGLGLVLALVLAPLFGLLTRRTPKPQRLEDQIAALARLPEEMRAPALLRLLQDRAPDAVAAFGDRLYLPGQSPDSNEIERVLRGVK